jgi:hypothetical protein
MTAPVLVAAAAPMIRRNAIGESECGLSWS